MSNFLDDIFDILEIGLYLSFSEKYGAVGFVCLDNSLELTMRKYSRHFANKDPRGKNIQALIKECDLNENKRDIEHFHDKRNNLYHEGITAPKKRDIINYFLLITKINKKLFNLEYEQRPNEIKIAEHLLDEYIQSGDNRIIDLLGNMLNLELTQISDEQLQDIKYNLEERLKRL